MEIKKDSRILVTGGKGFLGKAIYKKLNESGYNQVFTFRRREYDLTKEQEVARLFSENGSFDVVIHAAADVGGIGYNRKFPGSIYYNNLMMNTLIQEYARRNGVKKFVGIGSVCAYPKITDVPFKEEDLWKGYPEETNAGYGLAKKMMMLQSQLYRQEFDFNSIHFLMINLYGPEDHFDLEHSHVIPVLIRKFVSAKQNNDKQVIVWGTGNASRDFLYVDDAAKAVVLAMEKYDKPEPINLGSGNEFKIKDIVNKISKLSGFEGEIVWDKTKPDGQPRRCLNTSKAEREFGFKASTSLDEGLKKTINWFERNQDKIN